MPAANLSIDIHVLVRPTFSKFFPVNKLREESTGGNLGSFVLFFSNCLYLTATIFMGLRAPNLDFSKFFGQYGPIMALFKRLN